MVVTRRQGLILAGVLAALSVAAIVGVSVSETRDWMPWELCGLLFVLAIGSDMLIVEVRSFRVSGSFLAIVLAMALLGPTPAAVIGASSVALEALVTRRRIETAVNNIANYAIFPLV